MKKVLSMILAVMLVVSMIPAAYATEIGVDGAQTANTTVTYGLAEGYTVIIPDAIAIGSNGTGTGTLKASNVVIDSSETLNIKISGQDYVDAWELIDKADATNKLTYNIGKTAGASDVANNAIVLSCASGEHWNDEMAVTLYFKIAGDLTKSGAYEDTLTFTVSID